MRTEEKPCRTLPGKVQRIIAPLVPGDLEKAEISVDGADNLYCEIRIEDTMTNAHGEIVSLRPGAVVNIIIEAKPHDTTINRIETAPRPEWVRLP